MIWSMGISYKAFRSVKRKMKKGSNARKRTLAFDEYLRLIDKVPQHLKTFVIIAYNTGMPIGELRLLKGSYIDKNNNYIKLPEEVTKERRPKKYSNEPSCEKRAGFTSKSYSA
ncbi:MAG: hypothetical protein DRH24_15930 [Deltaproteobacteria bacterium]|nr:MAG: hypothetical protein DRH24_15930 [Deltaproteobacteria bacterium]